jgi:hypothetical protein
MDKIHKADYLTL